MTEQLNDLFIQIIRSEEKAQEKRAFLEKVKRQIEDQNEQLKQCKEKSKSLQGQLALKWHQLSESELRLVLLQKRSKLFKNQRDLQNEEYNQLVITKENLKEQLNENSEKFSAAVELYCSEYDLTASLSNHRTVVAQSKIERLKKEEDELLEELKIFDEKEVLFDELKARSTSLENEIGQRKIFVKELDSKINEESKERDSLANQKEVVCNVPNTNIEFKRLQCELNSQYEIGKQLDDMCGALQAELHELKQVKWRNQLHQSRKRQQSKMINESLKETTNGSSNFTRTSNYNHTSNSQEEIQNESDFVSASALLNGDQEFMEGDHTPVTPCSKKTNLSKLTNAIRSKRADRSSGQTNWTFERTGKFQFKKSGK